MSQTEIKTVWVYNGHEFPLDMRDYAVVERFENAVEKFRAAQAAMPKDGTGSARLKAYCDSFRLFFDTLFGDGTLDKVTEYTTNAGLIEDVYDSLLAFVNDQNTAVTERRYELANRYSANRLQRRAATKR